MVATAGKKAFLEQRHEVIEAFLKAGVAVALVDVRGTGETLPGKSGERGSTRTSISQINLILGTPVFAAQLADLHAAVDWLKSHKEIDADKVSFTQGMHITLVTTAKTDAAARMLLKEIGMPFAAE
jgi:alpha-beta hydrolase superfamily lysophospholipase